MATNAYELDTCRSKFCFVEDLTLMDYIMKEFLAAFAILNFKCNPTHPGSLPFFVVNLWRGKISNPLNSFILVWIAWPNRFCLNSRLYSISIQKIYCTTPGQRWPSINMKETEVDTHRDTSRRPIFTNSNQHPSGANK